VIGIQLFSVDEDFSGICLGNLIDDTDKEVFPAPLGPKRP
jgi:hypothetical protein